MKKTLIAVAALAATGAFAQNVTVSGTLDLAYRSISFDRADGTTYKSTQIGKDAIGTSGFILSGNEDLGGGLKAVYLYEQDFEPYDAAADGGGSAATTQGQIFVGLEGAFGAVKLGAPNAPHLTVQAARGAAFGTKDGGRVAIQGGTLMGTALTRFDRSVNYTSPTFSGFSAGISYRPKTETAPATVTGAVRDLGVFYNNGPISAGLASYNLDTGAGSDKQTSYYGSYNFGFAKFTLGGHTGESAAGVKNAGYNVAADVPLSGPLSATVNIQKLNDKSASNLDKSQTALGLQYAMSKRTVAYARYLKGSNDNQTGTSVTDANAVLFGLRHNF